MIKIRKVLAFFQLISYKFLKNFFFLIHLILNVRDKSQGEENGDSKEEDFTGSKHESETT